MFHRALLCRLIFCALFSVSAINVFTKAASPFLHYPRSSTVPRRELICPQSDLADDVLVILRTGATESQAKVPVHFRTTLRCVPHFTIMSDYEEEIDGHVVHDVLGSVSDTTKEKHDEFRLYHHLKAHGRRGMSHQSPITALSGSSRGDYLQTGREGWRLDKWKFLPMVERAYEEKPDAKWYVFIEADTYLGWNNLLQYLGNFDDTKPYYIGKHLYINGIEFGYGGAGFALSNPAMQKVNELRSTHLSDYEDFTASHWVGDCALGKVLQDAQVPLHRAFPHFQGDSPATVDPALEKIDRNLWCFPAITQHHVSSAEIEELWSFEQDWYARHSHVLRHRDIFMGLVRPKIGASVLNWDNMSADQEYNAHDHATSTDDFERNAWKSFGHCHALCDSRKDCIQFSFDTGSCSLSNSFHLGYAMPRERVRSGWMIDRVDDLFRSLEDRCGVRDWFAPINGARERTDLKMRRRRV